MGWIVSKEQEIDNVRFTSPKAGVVHKAELMVMLDRSHGGTGPDAALVKLANGKWTVLGVRHAPNGNRAVFPYGLSWVHENVLKALVKAGAITEEARLAHMSRVHENAEKQKRKYAMRDLERACIDLGIPIPQLASEDA